MKRLGILLLIFFLNCSFYSGAAEVATIEQGRELLRAGRYAEAAQVFQSLVEKNNSDTDAQEGLAQARIETGDYQTAEKQLSESLKSAPSAAALRVALGLIKLDTGRYNDAVAEFERAARTAKGAVLLRARLGHARALRAQGKEDEARPLLEEMARYYDENDPKTAEELTLVARALVLLEKFRDANDLFIDAREADDEFVEAYIGQGELLNEKYNYAEAASLFEDALKINPASPPALVGLAESKRLVSTSEPVSALERALATNPKYVPALSLKAWLDIEGERHEEATRQIERALAVDPNSVQAIALRAAIFYTADKRSEQEAEVKRALAVNPRAGELFETLAHFAMINRRYHDSVEYGRRAVELSPRLWSARTQLGIQLLRVGRVTDGRTELERTFAGDPFNIWAKNTLDLLDSMKDYTDTVRGPFLIKSAQKETGALGVYAADLLEEAHKRLTARYKFTPRSPITVELFPNHEDFAVRSFGLPGIGALGVCFGQVIAMDSPSARPVGQFNWGATLWHEYVHVVTLQITDYRIPRWFSEGLSVYEERRARPGWGDNWSLERLSAFKEGRFVSIENLDGAFTRPQSPDSVPLAYFQASLVCDFVDEKFGFDSILKMLALYKEGAKTGDVLKRALSLTPAEFDRAFHDYVKGKTDKFIAALGSNLTRAGAAEGPSKEALLVLVKTRPDDYFSHLRLGTIYKNEGQIDKAVEHLARAAELFPHYAGAGNPHAQLAEIYQQRGQKREAIAALETLVRHNETNLDALKQLAELKLGVGDRAGSIDALFTSFYVYPFNASLHKLAGDVYLEQGDARQAVREFRVLIALAPPDLAAAYYDLARSLEASGNRREAKREVLRSLEIAPGFEKAQELLLKLRVVD